MSTELVTLKKEQWPVLADSKASAASIVQNMAGEEISANLLNRIKVPAGGGTTWMVTDEAGEEQPIKDLQGVILHTIRRRGYWTNPDPLKVPPDCASTDMITGIGAPGGTCANCLHNQFGTSTKSDGTAGKGKACSERKLVFLLREGQFLPDVVSIPSASLKAMQMYQLRGLVPYAIWQVVTAFKLSKEVSSDGIDYAEVKPYRAGVLDVATAAALRDYAQAMQAVFSSAAKDFRNGDSEPVEV